MENPGLALALMIIGGIFAVLLVGYIIYILRDKDRELRKISLSVLKIGVVACVIFGFAHNIFVNPKYFNSLIRLDFSDPIFQAYLLVWGWRATLYFFFFVMWIRSTVRKARNWDKKEKIYSTLIWQALFLTTAWITDFEKLALVNGTVDLHHILHWVGGIIASLTFAIMEFTYLEKDINKYIGIRDNPLKIKRKFTLIYLGLVMLMMLASYAIIIGNMGVDSIQLILGKLLFFSLAFFILIFLIIQRQTQEFSVHLYQAVDFLKSAAQQDFSQSIAIESSDEFGELSDSLLTLKQNFRDVMHSARQSAQEVDNSALQLEKSVSDMTKQIDLVFVDLNNKAAEQTVSSLEASQKMDEMTQRITSVTENIQRQASLVEENSGAIVEINSTIAGITQRAQTARQIAVNLHEAAQDGSELLEETMRGMKDIAETSQRIGEINNLIDSVNEETGLLAMNAAIEAAHAGEHGKGFAIVAEEMRELSNNTASNANMIADLITEILTKIQHTVALMDDSRKGFGNISEWVDKSTNINIEISTAMEQQSATVQDVLNKTSGLVDITEEIRTFAQELRNTSLNIKNFLLTLKSVAENESRATEESSQLIIATVEQIREVIQNNKRVADELTQLILSFKLEADESSQQNQGDEHAE